MMDYRKRTQGRLSEGQHLFKNPVSTHKENKENYD
jgi:hypothetical protein